MKNKKQKTVVYSLTPTVQVYIRGIENGHFIRDDKDSVSKFLKWMLDKDVYPNCRGGMSGAGQYVGYFAPADIPAVTEFLTSLGLELLQEDDGSEGSGSTLREAVKDDQPKVNKNFS